MKTNEEEIDPVETELKEKKKDLIIIVLTDYTIYGDAAVSHAVALCMIFHAELCILPLNDKIKPESDIFLHSLNVAKEHNISITKHPYDNKLHKKIYDFSEEINSMMMVISVSQNPKDSFFNKSKALRWILKSRIPVVVVSSALPNKDSYSNVILPMDTSVYSKEKALWAGYFHKFYKASIHLLYKNYKDKYLENKLKANIHFTEKIYGNLEIPFQKHSIPDTWEDIESYAIKFAPEVHASLIVCLTTKYPSTGDIIFGRKEKHLLKRLNKIPYLFINQRDDLYVLCT